MSIGHVCNREAVVADRSDSLTDVAKLMRKYHVGSVIIVERHGEKARPIGIITDRDLVVEILAQELDTSAVALEDVMSPTLVTAEQDDHVYEVIEAMRNHRVRRMPVVDQEGFLVGVVAMDDLLWNLSQELGNIVTLIERQTGVEAKRQAHA